MSALDYEIRPMAWVVHPRGEDKFSELATNIRIVDEGAGEYVEVEQSGRKDLGKIAIDKDEWPALRETIERAFKNCLPGGGAA